MYPSASVFRSETPQCSEDGISYTHPSLLGAIGCGCEWQGLQMLRIQGKLRVVFLVADNCWCSSAINRFGTFWGPKIMGHQNPNVLEHHLPHHCKMAQAYPQFLGKSKWKMICPQNQPLCRVSKTSNVSSQPQQAKLCFAPWVRWVSVLLSQGICPPLWAISALSSWAPVWKLHHFSWKPTLFHGNIIYIYIYVNAVASPHPGLNTRWHLLSKPKGPSDIRSQPLRNQWMES